MEATTPMLAMTAALLLTLTATQTASACQISRTPWGLQASDCKLADFYGDRFGLTLDRNSMPGLSVRLANLAITDVDSTVIDKAVDVSFEVHNHGYGNAASFEVVLLPTVTDPLNGGQAASPPVPLAPVWVSGLAAGASVAKYAGRVFLPNRSQDWDVCTLAVVDPPPMPPGSAWGRVVESDESDNTWPVPPEGGCCRVYGPNPDVKNGPAACR